MTPLWRRRRRLDHRTAGEDAHSTSRPTSLDGVRSRDRAGRTPLHYAAVDGRLDRVAALIAAGAEIDAREDTGRYTPLMFAAQRDDNAEVVEALVEAGANVNLRNAKGQTPLYIATRTPATGPGGAAIIRYLLAHGADPHVAAKHGGTPIDYVKRVDDRFGRRAAFGDLLDEETSPRGTTEPIDQSQPERHGPTASITVTSTVWQTQFDELWNLLVPSAGSATTEQGEVIRLAGRLSREILDNGSINWNDDFRLMASALTTYPMTRNAVAGRDELDAIAQVIGDGDGDRAELYRLSELAVAWVLANPQPVPLGVVPYDH